MVPFSTPRINLTVCHECDTASVWDGGCWLDEVLMNDGGWFGDEKMNAHWRDSVHCKKKERFH